MTPPEPAEVQTARLIIGGVVGDAAAYDVLAALDTAPPGNLSRLVRLLTPDQLHALARQDRSAAGTHTMAASIAFTWGQLQVIAGALGLSDSDPPPTAAMITAMIEASGVVDDEAAAIELFGPDDEPP